MQNVSSAGSEVEVDGPQQSEKVGENEGVGFAIGTVRKTLASFLPRKKLIRDL